MGLKLQRLADMPHTPTWLALLAAWAAIALPLILAWYLTQKPRITLSSILRKKPIPADYEP